MNSLLKKVYIRKGNRVDPIEIIRILDEILKSRIESYIRVIPLEDAQVKKMEVILLCGVNGSGKTSVSIKIAKLLNQLDWKVAVASCDTYKPGASDIYLGEIDSNCIKVFTQNYGNESPYSVAKRAIERSKENNIDVLVLDTGGRMGKNNDLLLELKKIKNFAEKNAILKNSIFTLDVTLGNSAIKNLDYFSKIVGITGIIATKVDVTKKNFGLILSACEKHDIYIHGYSDSSKNNMIHEFESKIFIDAFIPQINAISKNYRKNF